MNTDNLVVAVSYAHDSDEFNKKVVAFVSCLREKHGYDAIMDEYIKQKETAVDFNEMMAKMIPNANKVIVLLTPKYKERADQFIGGVGDEYRIILEEIKTCPKKFIFASFVPINDEVVTRINPAALGNREIVYLSDDEQWDDLFSKLLDEPIIDFPDVANKKTKPRKKSIGFCGNKKKTDLFRETQILLCENKQILEQFGPDSLVAINNPMSSAINTWNQFKQNIIIPNNRKIVEAFESNISVLSMEEVEVYKKFKIHAEAFESCNKGEIIREGTPRFPVEFEQMIKGEK